MSKKLKAEAAELLGFIAVDLRDDYYGSALMKANQLQTILTKLVIRKYHEGEQK